MDWLDYALPLAKRFEGLRLRAYRCPAGVWTVGYGATGEHVGPDTRWTHEQAEADLAARFKRLGLVIARLVRQPLSPPQFAALALFADNCGVGALARSTLLRKLNQGDYAGAAREFDRWNRAGGRVLAGLVKRRAAERLLFEKADV
jgi:lysozyme